MINSYDGKDNWSMEDSRYHQFTKAAATSKTRVKPQSLAPTKNAAKYGFLRIHLQVNGVECGNSVQQEVSSDEDSVESDEEQRNIFDIFDV